MEQAQGTSCHVPTKNEKLNRLSYSAESVHRAPVEIALIVSELTVCSM